MEPVADGAATNRRAVPIGAALGVLVVVMPAAIWWLDAATVHAITIALIASAYVGFAVADGRPRVIAVESTIAFAFVVLAAATVTGSAWLIVVGYFGHGCKDLWQHRTTFVAGTRWWPPFCAAVDWVAAALIAGLIIGGVRFR